VVESAGTGAARMDVAAWLDRAAWLADQANQADLDRDWEAEDPDPELAWRADPGQDQADADAQAAAWLADDEVPGDEADDAPWTGEGEAFAAGFLHRDTDGLPGIGFASGGELDMMDPGPQLATQLTAATSGGPQLATQLTAATSRAKGYPALGESELIGVLCGWQRMAAWAAAGQAAAITALVARRQTQARDRRNQHLAEHVPSEIAAALVLTGQAAAVLTDDTAAIARLPQVHEALAAGVIDWRRAVVFGSELAALHDADAARIAAGVLPSAGRLTTSQIRRLLRRAVLDFDPDAAVRRAADAAAEAGVHAWTEPSGNAALAGRELPEADVITADRRLTALARWLTRNGATGTRQQLRAAAFLALLTGRDMQSLLPSAAPGQPASHDPAATRSADGGASGSSSGRAAVRGDVADPGGGHATANPSVPPVTGTINLTLPLSTWAGLVSRSGEIAGYGPAEAATCTALGSRLAASRATSWCLTLTDPDGHPLAHACAPRTRPPPDGPAALRWAAALVSKLRWLQSGSCTHRGQEDRYEPSNSLAHLIRVRQRTCSFPGCSRPAVRCDLDHTIAYDQGGPTCECNLAPLCRTHHRAKQAPRWHLAQDQPGQMTWQLPSGRTYQPAAIGYPS
jgi:hypothetical protein